MKSTTLPLFCGTLLALMAGAVGSHFWQLETLGFLPATTPAVEPQPAPPSVPAPDETKRLIHTVRQQNAAMQADLQRRIPAASKPNDRLDQVLSELVAINRELRSQIAETNRDLMELRFQVDTHSEQFRPLNQVEEPADEVESYDPSIGVLPPRELE